jgi:hypothetical protein
VALTDRQSAKEVATMALGIIETAGGAQAPTDRRTDEATTPSRDLEVVAEILADGTIRSRGDRRIKVDERTAGWSTGHIGGRGWVLWWQRRT